MRQRIVALSKYFGKIAGILDTASMKVIAISRRGTKRDIVDLYFILQDMPFNKIAECMVLDFRRDSNYYLQPIISIFHDLSAVLFKPHLVYGQGHENYEARTEN